MSDGPQEYSDESFWEKVRKYALVAGQEVIQKALWLYYAAHSKETPAWAKTIIYGSLAYFIWPVDAIPDAIPVAGYSDDLGALAAALAMISMCITTDVKVVADQKMEDWFGQRE